MIMNKSELNRIALMLANDNEALVYAEKQKGKPAEIAIAGDFITMLYVVGGIINRIAEKTETSFEETLIAVNAIRQIGLENAKEAMRGGEKEFIEGEDWQEEWKAAKEKEISKSNIALTAELERTQTKVTSLTNQIVDIKKQNAETLKLKDKQIAELTKELTALEHRFDELSQKMLGAENIG